MMGRLARPAFALAAAGLGAAWVGLVRGDRRAIAGDARRELIDLDLDTIVPGRPFEVAGADGTPVRGRCFGDDDAPAIVLAHGWTCSHRFWIEQIRQLAPSNRVIAYDLRGHARSGRPASGDYSIEAHARDLAAVLDTNLAAGERAVVAGHSMGAMSLVALAGIDPQTIRERVAAAALINTGMGDLIAGSLVFGPGGSSPPQLASLGRALFTAPVRLPAKPTPISHRVIRHLALDRGASPAEVAFCERIVLECPADVRAGCGKTLSRLDLYAAVAKLDVPTVVIAGRRDRLTPPRHARRLLAALAQPDAPLIIKDAGHMMPVTHPNLVSGTIRALAERHLGEVSRRRGARESSV